MNTPQKWQVETLNDGTYSLKYEGKSHINGKWHLWDDALKIRERDRLMLEAAPLMLAALQRITHPAADDTDLENALQVIKQATGE